MLIIKTVKLTNRKLFKLLKKSLILKIITIKSSRKNHQNYLKGFLERK